nr:hypothetical protein [Tanacetum cinerariifolium]
MVNTRTDADLSAAVQNALQTLLPQICVKIREEFRTSSGPMHLRQDLAVYKFEGNALAWWKAYKQAKGGDAWLITVTWADFKKQKSGDRHQPTSQQSIHRSYGHNNDHQGSDRRGGSDNDRSSNNNYSGSNNGLNFKSTQSSSTHEHDPNITA